MSARESTEQIEKPETVSPEAQSPGQLRIRAIDESETERAHRVTVHFSSTHPYVESCWLPIIGPSATWCIRRLGAELAKHPTGVTLELAELGADLGLGPHLGKNAPLARTLQRLCDFGLARIAEDQSLEVHTSLPPIGSRALARLGEKAARLHHEMFAEASNPLLSAALSYARRGWPVLPLHVGEKTPDGWLVRHGLKEASTDDTVVRAWWAASPQANIGIRTGLGLDVLDLDSEAAYRALSDRFPEALKAKVVVATGRGRHLWFASSGLSSRAGVIEGLDVRANGGYVVAPPSVHPNGQRYAFLDQPGGELHPTLSDGPLTPVPSSLLEYLRAPTQEPRREAMPIRLKSTHYVAAAVDAECAAVATCGEGARNDRLNKAAFSLGTLVGAELLDAGDAREHLLAAALRAGLEQSEALRTISSGLSAGERQPRRVEVAEANRVTGVDKGRSPASSPRPEARATAAVLARAEHSATVGPSVAPAAGARKNLER